MVRESRERKIRCDIPIPSRSAGISLDPGLQHASPLDGELRRGELRWNPASHSKAGNLGRGP